jgi:hypothetical protein
MKQQLEPHLAVLRLVRGAAQTTVVFNLTDVVTVTQGERFAKCRAIAEVRLEPPIPGALPIPPQPTQYVVELTDDNRLMFREVDGTSSR